MNAHHHRTAPDAIRPGVVFNQMDLPQRPFGVQTLGGQQGHAVLQRTLLVATFRRFWQGFKHHMVGQVKFAVIDPGCTGSVLHHTLLEAAVLEQTVFNPLAHRRMLDAGGQLPHAHNHHQVGIAIHAQPGSVDFAHALAANAQCARHRPFDIFLNLGGGIKCHVLCDCSAVFDAGDHEYFLQLTCPIG